MKTTIIFCFSILVLGLSHLSFSVPKTLKKVTDENFRYEFYITDKKVDPRIEKTYYWYRGGAIHDAQGGIAGDLLHDKFIKMYHSNQLAEQGVFRNGLKVGLWKTWHPNGIIKTKQYWSNGLKTGVFYRYDDKGILIEKGRYNNDLKNSRWIDYIKRDTIIYKRGVVIIQKPKLNREERIQLREQNKKAKEDKKALKKSEKANKEAAKTAAKEAKKANKTAAPKKENLFNRIFSKKTSTTSAVTPNEPAAPKKESFFNRIFAKKPQK